MQVLAVLGGLLHVNDMIVPPVEAKLLNCSALVGACLRSRTFLNRFYPVHLRWRIDAGNAPGAPGGLIKYIEVFAEHLLLGVFGCSIVKAQTEFLEDFG